MLAVLRRRIDGTVGSRGLSVTGERIYSFFIVKNLAESINFYNQKLGFEADLLVPEEDPFFG